MTTQDRPGVFVPRPTGTPTLRLLEQTVTTNPNPDRTSEVYAAIDAFQRTHRLPGLAHAQIRGLLAEHLACALPSSAVSVVPPATNQTALRKLIGQVLRPWLVGGDDADVARRVGHAADAVMALWPAPVDPAAETPQTVPRTLAYSNGKTGPVFCVACPRPADPVPLTVDDVEQQARCTSCGRYVVDVAEGYAPAVVAQPGKEPS